MFWTFVATLPPGARLSGMAELLDGFVAIYTSRGHPVPRWLQRVRERALCSDPVNIGRLNPARTIYGSQWTGLVAAVTRAPLEFHPGLRAILIELEAGWARLRPILELTTHEPVRIDQCDAVSLFASDTAELFRSAVFDCAEWLTAYANALRGRAGVAPDHANILGDVSRFAAHATFLAFAADTAGVNPWLDRAARTLSREARRWAGRVEPAVRALPELELAGVEV